MARTDDVGAAAAAHYFVSLYAYTLQTGDVRAWEEMSFERCGFCHGIRDDALQATSSGERIEGGELTLSDVTVLPKDDLIGGYPVEARFSQASEVRRGPDGSVLSTAEPDEGSVRIDTINLGGVWKILAVVVRDA